MTLKTYITMLERELLELPGEPYVRCAVCEQVRNVNATKEACFGFARFHYCEHCECQERAEAMLGQAYAEQYAIY